MGLSRREFLIGAGAAVGIAGAGIGVLDAADHSLFERGLHKVGLASSPNRQFPTSGAQEESGILQSRYMGRAINWTVSRPAGVRSPTGIIFCLHGRGGDHRFAFDQVQVPDAAASVGLRVAVAAVDGGADSYWHKRTDGTDALGMLLNEFVPTVQSMVGDVPKGLLGWSMGGYGALLAAERQPTNFVAVSPASPALWLTPGETAPGAFDSSADYYANDVFTGISRLRGIAIAVACGTGDPFYSATQHLASLMNFPHHAFFGTGYHDPAYWRSALPYQLQAIQPALS